MRSRGFLQGFLVLSVLAGSIGWSATVTQPVGGLSLNKPLSVRQMGMAGVGQASGGVLAMWSNPAFLMDMETRGELAVGGGAMNDGYENFGTVGGGWKVADNWALGGFMGINGITIPEVDGFGEPVGADLTEDTFALGGGGAYEWRWLTAGMTVKVASQNLMNQNNTTACGDLGLAGKWGPLGAGLSFRNLGGKLIQPEPAVDGNQLFKDGVALPMEFRIGASYRYSPWNLTPALEVRKTSQRDGIIGVGADWKASNWIAFRFGINGAIGSTGSNTNPSANSSGGSGNNSNGPGAGSDFSMGLTGFYKQFALDFAFVNAQTGISSRVNVSYALGARSAESADQVSEPDKPREEIQQVESPVVPLKPGEKKLNFAIADLRGENVSAGDAAVMADLLRNELVKTEQFTVIEKQNMDKVLSEHAFQQTGCSSEECAVKLGKLLNVQRMAVGSFGKLMDSYILSIRVVNVETGAIIYADSAEGEKVSQLRGGVKDMAVRMAKKIR